MDDPHEPHEADPDPGSPATPTVPRLAELGPRFVRFVEQLERPLVFFDVETTGTDPMSDRIIELCMLRVAPPDVIAPPRTWRVDPGIRIPVESTRIHGMTNEHLMGAPSFAEIAHEVLEVIHGADLAGFTVGRFDVRVLHAELQRVNHSLDIDSIRIVDAQVIYHRREPRSLAAALRFYCGQELVDAHGAQADTIASLQVFAGQLERYPDLGDDVAGLHALSGSLNEGYCDSGRRFIWRDDEPAFNFGKLKGKSLRFVAGDPDDRKYLRWMLDGEFEKDTKAIVQDALCGAIRRRTSAV